MKQLDSSARAFTASVREFYEFLEDHYESPEMAEKLAYFRECLVSFTESSPEYSECILDSDHEKAYRDTLVERSKDFLAALEDVDADSNVFDVIEVLRANCIRIETVWEVGYTFGK